MRTSHRDPEAARRCTRREFVIRGAMAAGALCGAASCASPGRPRPRRPSGDVLVAVAGVRQKGWQLATHFAGLPGVKVVALCDPDREILADRAKQFEADHGVAPRTFADVREALEMREVDAVALGTPNHWHALQTLWACEAGKHVYVEKPATHTLFESAQVAQAPARYGSIVQAGTQNRSDVGLREAFPWLRGGGLGRIRRVTAVVYRLRGSIGRTEGPQALPPSLDYDLWCGPAPMGPLRRKSLHYDWHWFWDTGGGEVSNQGPHELDLARWLLGDPPAPTRVLTVGGRLGYEDDAQTPNTVLSLLDFGGIPVVLEVRGLALRKDLDAEPALRGIRVGVIVDCERGYFAGGRGGGKAFTHDKELVRHFPGDAGAGHAQNFIDAIRAGSAEKLHAPIGVGADSADLCHLVNISHRVGRRTEPAAAAAAFAGDREASSSFDRLLEHLDANGVDPAKTQLTLGAHLAWDGRARRFAGGDRAEEANGLVSREYRAPYVVPRLD
jgi:predicted dehydrogenase